MVENKNKKSFGFYAVIAFIFALVLQITFVLLKVFSVISWNWVYVLMPALIIGAGFLLLILFLLLYIVVLGRHYDDDEE